VKVPFELGIFLNEPADFIFDQVQEGEARARLTAVASRSLFPEQGVPYLHQAGAFRHGAGGQGIFQKVQEVIIPGLTLEPHFVGIKLVGDAVDIVGQGQRCGGAAVDPGLPVRQTGEELLQAGRARHFRVDAADGERTVVVGAAGEVLAPGFRKSRHNAMFIHELVIAGRRQVPQDAAQEEIELIIPAAVDFEVFKEEQELFKMFHGQAAVYRPEGVGQGVGDAFLL